MTAFHVLLRIVRDEFQHSLARRTILRWAGLVAVASLVFICSCPGAVFTDSLTNGYSPANWLLYTNTSLFTVATNGGDVAFSKPQGSVNTTIQYATLASLVAARGNFSVQLDFTNATITEVSGSIGNQIQLNTRFGGQDFLMVRSDEGGLGGQNAHVYPSPPGTVGMGAIPWSSNYGTLRVVRTNTQVSGYIGSNLLYQNNYNTNDATFSFVLQNNHTSDAVSCGFLNFRLTADQIMPLPRQLNGYVSGPGALILSWPDTSWPDFLGGYTLLSTTNLSATNAWQTVVANPSLKNDQYLIPITNSGTSTFFRLLQGP